jgi:hypothetical protein
MRARVQEAELAIATGRLAELQQGVLQEIAALTALDLSARRLSHLKAAALILDLIHHRDVTAALQESRTGSVTEWEWHRRLRYYASAPALRDGNTGAPTKGARCTFASWTTSQQECIST